MGFELANPEHPQTCHEQAISQAEIFVLFGSFRMVAEKPPLCLVFFWFRYSSKFKNV
jgi:hypothetical protein